MTHPIRFTKSLKLNLSTLIDERIQEINFSRYGNEPNYTPAFIQHLSGFIYEDEQWKITFDGAVMTSVGQYSAEGWSGADCAIVTTISEIDKQDIRKASLVQAKRGTIESLNAKERNRLEEQIKDMKALTKHPKVLEIYKDKGLLPTVVSANGILSKKRLQHQTFGRWVSTRVLPTFDGDTRPHFIEAVLEANLDKLRIYAREKSKSDEIVEKTPLLLEPYLTLNLSNSIPSPIKSSYDERSDEMK